MARQSSDWRFATWAKVAWALPRKMMEDEAPGRAAQMSFYFFLSIFPTLLLLMAVLGMFLDAQWLLRETVLDRLAAVAPAPTVRVFVRLLDHLAGRAPVPMTWGAILAVWASSSGMVAAIRGLNKVYAVTEQRPWWRRRLVGLALTLVLLMLTAAAMLLLAYGVPIAHAIARGLGLRPAMVLLWEIVQWPLILGFVLAAFNLLYHFGPHRPQVRWRWFRPGSLIAVALWLLASLSLKLYADRFGEYNVAYGSLGAVIVLLLWFYLACLAILAGAEINAIMDEAQAGAGVPATAGR